MTAAALSRPAGHAPGRPGFRAAARMEWLKLRSVRSTWWILELSAASMIGVAILTMHFAPARPGPGFDAVETGFAGLAIAQLSAGVLGVLAVTGEYSSGMIRATLTAVPRRPLVLAVKAAVLTADAWRRGGACGRRGPGGPRETACLGPASRADPAG